MGSYLTKVVNMRAANSGFQQSDSRIQTLQMQESWDKLPLEMTLRL